jgi:hypothetical protein
MKIVLEEREKGRERREFDEQSGQINILCERGKRRIIFSILTERCSVPIAMPRTTTVKTGNLRKMEMAVMSVFFSQLSVMRRCNNQLFDDQTDCSSTTIYTWRSRCFPRGKGRNARTRVLGPQTRQRERDRDKNIYARDITEIFLASQPIIASCFLFPVCLR